MSRQTHQGWIVSRNRPLRRQGKRGSSVGGYFRRLRLEPLEDRRMLALLMVNSDLDNTIGGDGLVTLREAIDAANAPGTVTDLGDVSDPGLDSVAFDPTLDGSTILLDNLLGEMPIIEDLTIDAGPLVVGLQIDAGHGFDSLPGTFDGIRIFNVDDLVPGPTIFVEMIGLTLTGGDLLGDGGAILNFEDLTLTEMTITENAADGSGGGVSNLGNLMLDLTEVSDNTATFFGGGINSFGNLEINRSTMSGNEVPIGSGGGVYAFTGGGYMLAVNDSTISGNMASDDGGGIGMFTALGGAAAVTNSTVSGNEAGGYGGGVFSYTDAASITTIQHSTITGNSSDSDFDGFGTGGGIYTTGLGVPTVDNTIVAPNFGGALPPSDITGMAIGTFNLIGVDTGLVGIVNLIGGNMVGTAAVPIDPMLAPLFNNGGPTETHRLLPASPAIDAGDPLYVGPPFEDQRGVPFAREDFATLMLDIGAYELQDVGAPMLLVVDTLADENDGDYAPGDLSLREAIGLANGNFGLLDTIEFDPALAGQTIVLTKGEIGIREDVLIDAGALPAAVTIEAFDPSPVAGDGSRIFNIDDGFFATVITAELVGLALIGGDPAGAGGAIFNVENLTLTGCRISENASLGDGGGVFSVDGILEINDSTLSGNTAGGNGGGLFAATGPYGSVMISDSTISGNSAALDGGGIEVLNFSLPGTLISNSTISGNEADGDGGGVFADTGAAYLTTVEHSTITANIANDDGVGGESGGGTFAAGAGAFEIDHTIIAQNFDGTGLDDDLDGMTVATFSLVGVDTTGTIVDVIGNQIGLGLPIDPILGPLSNNGGPTLTHALLPGSPALDAGDFLFAGPPFEDQRGIPFARVDAFGPLVIDIGAYERQDLGGPMVWVVDSLDDWSDGDYSFGNLTLREAIGLANGNVGFDDAIEFDAGLGGSTISLNRLLGELVITEGVTINAAPLAAGLTIEAFDPTPAVKNGDGSRIFNIDDGDLGTFIDVEIVGLTLTGGDVATSGGAIRSLETLTVVGCTISDNATFGGGAFGGGIYSGPGVLTIDSSVISDNSISGILALGGGIASEGDLFITDSTISENAVLAGPGAGGGIWAGASLTLTRSTVADNFTLGASMAGGIDASAAGATLTIQSSTISGNSTTGDGGGIRVATDSFTITSSTISGNSADGNGGGIFFANGMITVSTISHSTITDNTADADAAGGGQAGGGIGMTGPLIGTLELDHTIVAANMDSAGSAPDIKTVIVIGSLAASYSLIGEDTGAMITDVVGNQIGTSASPIDPELEPLAFNGGPTRTHELKTTSPALDAGEPSFAFPPFYDQRGAPYTRDYDGDGVGGSQIDIGAFERQPFAALPALLGDYNGDSVVDAADYTVWRDALGDPVTRYTGADGSGNGVVDENDYVVWRANFGNVLGPGSGGTADSASGGGQTADTTTVEQAAVATTVESTHPVALAESTQATQESGPSATFAAETDGHHPKREARKSEDFRPLRRRAHTKRIASHELLLASVASWGDNSPGNSDGDAHHPRAKRRGDESTAQWSAEVDLVFECLGSGRDRLY